MGFESPSFRPSRVRGSTLAGGSFSTGVSALLLRFRGVVDSSTTGSSFRSTRRGVMGLGVYDGVDAYDVVGA
jgi:hypothetical protein